MTMTTTEIAAKYFELYSQGENSEAKVLYSPDADKKPSMQKGFKTEVLKPFKASSARS